MFDADGARGTVPGWRQSACIPSHVLTLGEKYATLQCSDRQKVIGIIEAGASGRKLKHGCILRARKKVADKIWGHEAIDAEDNHIK
jgi:hypothetical protein